MIFFFFKQKTAYEMRISDWSSVVCSSDLQTKGEAAAGGPGFFGGDRRAEERVLRIEIVDPRRGDQIAARRADQRVGDGEAPAPRSEEHTSELQSLMRISYAVFCLKKKIKKT